MLDQARELDADDKPLDAISAYEEAIRSPEGTLEDYLNLAGLYFSCTDLGFAAGHHIPDDLWHTAFEKVRRILLEAELRFGRTPEVEFWQLYVSWVSLGGPPFVERARELAESGCLIAYLHLLDEGPYQKPAQKLRDQAAAGRSARERYVRSVLDSPVLRNWFASHD